MSNVTVEAIAVFKDAAGKIAKTIFHAIGTDYPAAFAAAQAIANDLLSVSDLQLAGLSAVVKLTPTSTGTAAAENSTGFSRASMRMEARVPTAAGGFVNLGIPGEKVTLVDETQVNLPLVTGSGSAWDTMLAAAISHGIVDKYGNALLAAPEATGRNRFRPRRRG